MFLSGVCIVGLREQHFGLGEDVARGQMGPGTIESGSLGPQTQKPGKNLQWPLCVPQGAAVLSPTACHEFVGLSAKQNAEPPFQKLLKMPNS